MTNFISTIPFKEEFPDTIVVCCSDGRTRKHVAEFLEKYNVDADIYAVPGGPIVLAGGVETFQDGMVAEKRLRFLAEVHHTERIILIAHGGLKESCECGMAQQMWPRASCEERVEKLKVALLKASQRASSALKLPVFSFYANTMDDMVQFEEVKAAGAAQSYADSEKNRATSSRANAGSSR